MNKDKTEPTPVEYCDSLIAAFSKKANHNKSEALACFIIIIAATLIGPMFVSLAEGLFWGKVVPSALSLLAAGATAWIQLRKPQSLWTLYRSIQRELEDVRVRYNYQIGEFAQSEDCDKILAERSANLAISAHHQWLSLAPTPEAIVKDKETASITKHGGSKSQNGS